MPYWLRTVAPGYLLGHKPMLFGFITGALNRMHCSDICLGMLCKTCEVRTVSCDNPPPGTHGAAAPSFLHLPLHRCDAHLFTTMLGRRAASAAEWNDNEDRPSLSFHWFTLSLSFSPHPFSVYLSKHSSCNLLMLKNTDSICIHESLIVTKESNHSAGCWQENCHLECHTHTHINAVFSSLPTSSTVLALPQSSSFVSHQLFR